jgi:hypothetical protein
MDEDIQAKQAEREYYAELDRQYSEWLADQLASQDVPEEPAHLHDIPPIT